MVNVSLTFGELCLALVKFSLTLEELSLTLEELSLALVEFSLTFVHGSLTLAACSLTLAEFTFHFAEVNLSFTGGLTPFCVNIKKNPDFPKVLPFVQDSKALPGCHVSAFQRHVVPAIPSKAKGGETHGKEPNRVRER